MRELWLRRNEPMTLSVHGILGSWSKEPGAALPLHPAIWNLMRNPNDPHNFHKHVQWDQAMGTLICTKVGSFDANIRVEMENENALSLWLPVRIHCLPEDTPFALFEMVAVPQASDPA
jgi:hypothetical protein